MHLEENSFIECICSEPPYQTPATFRIPTDSSRLCLGESETGRGTASLKAFTERGRERPRKAETEVSQVLTMMHQTCFVSEEGKNFSSGERSEKSTTPWLVVFSESPSFPEANPSPSSPAADR